MSIASKVEKGLFLLATYPVSFYKRTKQFKFMGKSFKYFFHPYNRTWFNERSVEIPVFIDIVKKNKGKEILEIGNVLAYYYPFEHDIVDKYEEGDGVDNADIVGYDKGKKYDLIIAISTIEHVGWDETPREPQKIIKALASMKKLLNKNGKIIISVPLDYNKDLDVLFQKSKLDFDQEFFLKRISPDNNWIEVKKKDIGTPRYDMRFYRADTLLFGIINK